MKQCIYEGSGFIDEQISHLQVQPTELRRDFVEAITEEQETHPLNIVGHRLETLNFAQEWKTIETKVASQTPCGPAFGSC